VGWWGKKPLVGSTGGGFFLWLELPLTNLARVASGSNARVRRFLFHEHVAAPPWGNTFPRERPIRPDPTPSVLGGPIRTWKRPAPPSALGQPIQT